MPRRSRSRKLKLLSRARKNLSRSLRVRSLRPRLMPPSRLPKLPRRPQKPVRRLPRLR